MVCTAGLATFLLSQAIVCLFDMHRDCPDRRELNGAIVTCISEHGQNSPCGEHVDNVDIAKNALSIVMQGLELDPAMLRDIEAGLGGPQVSCSDITILPPAMSPDSNVCSPCLGLMLMQHAITCQYEVSKVPGGCPSTTSYEEKVGYVAHGPFEVGTSGCAGVGECQFQTRDDATDFCDQQPDCTAVLLHPAGDNCAGGFGCYTPRSGELTENAAWQSNGGKTFARVSEVQCPGHGLLTPEFGTCLFTAVDMICPAPPTEIPTAAEGGNTTLLAIAAFKIVVGVLGLTDVQMVGVLTWMREALRGEGGVSADGNRADN